MKEVAHYYSYGHNVDMTYQTYGGEVYEGGREEALQRAQSGHQSNDRASTNSHARGIEVHFDNETLLVERILICNLRKASQYGQGDLPEENPQWVEVSTARIQNCWDYRYLWELKVGGDLIPPCPEEEE